MKRKLFALFLSLSAFALAPQAVRAEAKVNAPAPEFKLTDIDGKQRSLSEFKGKYVVLEWTNYGCPFVKKHYDSGNMQNLQKEWTGKNVVWLAVCSSAKGKEGYLSAQEWKAASQKHNSAATAILLDDQGKVGKLYEAKTTPHMFVINPEGVLIYKGAIDSIKSADPDDIPKATNYVAAALTEAMANKPVSTNSTQSYGCSVKY